MDQYDNSYDINNDDFLKYQHYCWPSHTAHFHTTFTEYKNCEFTCVEEIEEFVTKVNLAKQKENQCK